MRFRPVETETHLFTLGSLDAELFGYDERLSPSDLNRSTWWLGWEDGEPVAYCGIRHWYDNRAFLSRAGVLEGYRGGLQRRMIRLRERHARRNGWARILTYTAHNNTHSANNLIDCGYHLWVGAKERSTVWLSFFKDL